MAAAVHFRIVFLRISTLDFHLDCLATGKIHNLFIHFPTFYSVVNSPWVLRIINHNSLRKDLLDISIVHIDNWIIERKCLFQVSLKMFSLYFSILIISFSLSISNNLLYPGQLFMSQGESDYLWFSYSIESIRFIRTYIAWGSFRWD